MRMGCSQLGFQRFKLSFPRAVARLGYQSQKMSSTRVGARFFFKYWLVAYVFVKVLVLAENGS